MVHAQLSTDGMRLVLVTQGEPPSCAYSDKVNTNLLEGDCVQDFANDAYELHNVIAWRRVPLP